MITKVNINMGPIFNGYRVMGVFQMSEMSFCEPCKLQVAPHNLETAGIVNRSCNSQLTLLTTEPKHEFQLEVAFFKICL